MRLLSSIIKSHRVTGEKVIEIGKQLILPRVHECDHDEPVDQKQYEALIEKAQKEKEILIEEAQDQIRIMQQEAKIALQERERQQREDMIRLEEEARIKAKQIEEQAYIRADELRKRAELEKEQILAEAEPEIVALVQKLVGHIIHEELVHHTEWITLLVRKIYQHEMTKESITVSMNPQIYERLSDKQKEELMHMGEGIRLKTDENMSVTRCEFETSQGSISYDIEEGLDKILKELAILQSL